MRSSGRHGALVLALTALFAACDRPPETPVGVSAGGRIAPGNDAGLVKKPTSTLIPPDFRERLTRLAPRFPSQGHAAGRFEVAVYGNEAAATGLGRHLGAFPVGTLFVKEHWEAGNGNTKAGSIMSMEKMAPGFDPGHGDWRYVVLTADGDVAAEGKPEGCVTCHDDAPHDHVFRLPGAR